MAINKVIYGNNTLIDLTSDTATEDKVLSGYTFHKATGEVAVGTASGGGDIPNGKTVTPTDDIQTWLHCAGIFDNNYTTLAEVLNDLTIYNALLSDSNACDYMARSTSWALVEGAVPVMTDNTHPSGEVLYSSQLSTQLAYHAFDGLATEGNTWSSATRSFPEYIGYHFDSPVCINKISLSQRTLSNYAGVTQTVKIQASNDKFVNDIHDLTDSFTYVIIVASGAKALDFYLNNTDAYSDYRVYITATSNSQVFPTTAEIQLYPISITTYQDAMRILGKYDYACEVLLSNPTWLDAIVNSEYHEQVLDIEVPIMTSNTAPSGQCEGGPNVNGSYPAYRCFDGNDTTQASLQSVNKTAYIQYDFPSSENICAFSFLIKSGSGQGITLQISCSDDNNNFTPCGSYRYEIVDTNTLKTYALDADYGSHRYWRLTRVLDTTAWSDIAYTVQFYGRTPVNKIKYVPLVPTMTSNTTPSGECIRSSIYSSSYEAFKAFDKNTSTWWNANGGAGEWIGYTFEYPVILNKLYLNAINTTKVGTLKLQGSNDGFVGDINDITSQFTPSAFPYVLEFDNNVQYQSYRIINISGTTDFNVYEIQFYAKRNPEPAIIHCATDDEITITAEDFETTIYAYGDTATLPADIPSGLYTFTSAVLSNPSYPDQPYTQNVYITEHTTEIYFMPENMETVLWTNSAPTSAFATQTVTLSDSIDNYKYIKISYRASTSNSETSSVIMSVEDLKNTDTFSGTGLTYGSMSGNGYKVRDYYYVNNTSISFTQGFQINAQATDNSSCIPLEITGLNKLRTGKKSSKTTTTLWANPNPTASAGFATQDVNLSDNISNYDYIELEFILNITAPTDKIKTAVPSDELKNNYIGSNWWGSSVTIYAGGYYYTRYFKYVSETKMNLTSGLKSKAGSSGSSFSNAIIPTNIYGIKYE